MTTYCILLPGLFTSTIDSRHFFFFTHHLHTRTLKLELAKYTLPTASTCHKQSQTLLGLYAPKALTHTASPSTKGPPRGPTCQASPRCLLPREGT